MKYLQSSFKMLKSFGKATKMNIEEYTEQEMIILHTVYEVLIHLT